MKPVSFYLVTDTHYLDSKLEPGGEAFEKNMVTEQYFVKESGDKYSKKISYELAVKGRTQKIFNEIYQSVIEFFSKRTVTYPDYK